MQTSADVMIIQMAATEGHGVQPSDALFHHCGDLSSVNRVSLSTSENPVDPVEEALTRCLYERHWL